MALHLADSRWRRNAGRILTAAVPAPVPPHPAVATIPVVVSPVAVSPAVVAAPERSGEAVPAASARFIQFPNFLLGVVAPVAITVHVLFDIPLQLADAPLAPPVVSVAGLAKTDLRVRSTAQQEKCSSGKCNRDSGSHRFPLSNVPSTCLGWSGTLPIRKDVVRSGCVARRAQKGGSDGFRLSSLRPASGGISPWSA